MRRRYAEWRVSDRRQRLSNNQWMMCWSTDGSSTYVTSQAQIDVSDRQTPCTCQNDDRSRDLMNLGARLLVPP